MYTKTERKKLETALKRVKKCGGDCKHCEKCHIYTSRNGLYFAVGCDLLPEKYFDCIANVPSELHAAAIETLEFELSL